MMLQATVSKTVDVTSGGLSSVLSYTELTTVTDLTITGSIDATDFVTMRDNMPALAVLDISAVTITAYNGSNGTCGDTSYPTNAIPEYSFYTNNGKTTLQSVTLPNSVTAIGDNAFNDCTGLTNVTIPDAVTAIGNYAFNNCTGLTNVTIGNSVTAIGIAAFASCTGLTNIAISNSVTSLGNNAFAFCTGLTNATIGNSVTSLGNNAFYNCSGLTSIIIPSSVSSIGIYAFYGCSGLNSIYAYPTTPVNLSLSPDVFYSVNTSACYLFVPIGSLSAYKAAYQWDAFTHIVGRTISAVSTTSTDPVYLYPNPVTDGFFIKGLNGNGILTILDISGNTLLTTQVSSNEVSLSTFSKGLYIVKIITAEGTIERKLLKE
jgi:hypothetical protein